MVHDMVRWICISAGGLRYVQICLNMVTNMVYLIYSHDIHKDMLYLGTGCCSERPWGSYWELGGERVVISVWERCSKRVERIGELIERRYERHWRRGERLWRRDEHLSDTGEWLSN